MITVSSGSITTQALISPGLPVLSSLQGRTLRLAASAEFIRPTPSTNPPAAVSEVVTNVRRESVLSIIVIVVSSPLTAHQGGRTMHRAAEPLIGAATADVGETGVDIR